MTRWLLPTFWVEIYDDWRIWSVCISWFIEMVGFLKVYSGKINTRVWPKLKLSRFQRRHKPQTTDCKPNCCEIKLWSQTPLTLLAHILAKLKFIMNTDGPPLICCQAHSRLLLCQPLLPLYVLQLCKWLELLWQEWWEELVFGVVFSQILNIYEQWLPVCLYRPFYATLKMQQIFKLWISKDGCSCIKLLNPRWNNAWLELWKRAVL